MEYVMAFISARKSIDRIYRSICESRRIDSKQRNIVLEYSGNTAEILLKRMHGSEYVAVKTYFHGAVTVLLQTTIDLDTSPFFVILAQSIKAIC